MNKVILIGNTVRPIELRYLPSGSAVAKAGIAVNRTWKNKRKLETIPIKGLGGTILQPAINLVAEEFNDYNTVVLTD